MRQRGTIPAQTNMRFCFHLNAPRRGSMVEECISISGRNGDINVDQVRIIIDKKALSKMSLSSARANIPSQAQSENESDWVDWTDDECAVIDGSDSENDTRPVQKHDRRPLRAMKTSILSMELKGKTCPKNARPLQVAQIRQRIRNSIVDRSGQSRPKRRFLAITGKLSPRAGVALTSREAGSKGASTTRSCLVSGFMRVDTVTSPSTLQDMLQSLYSKEDVRAALQVLQQAPDDALFSVRTDVLTTVINLRKRLMLSDLQKNGVADTIDLERSGQADTRLQHIYAVQPGAKDPKSSVRALFAYRSLGFEFDRYFRRRCGTSRVAELAKDIRKAEKKGGCIRDFLKDRGLDEESSYKAVRFAIKILVLEELFGNPGVSILVSFVYSKIRDLPYLSLRDISHLLSTEGGDFSELAGLARSCSDFVNDGQKQYEAGPNQFNTPGEQNRNARADQAVALQNSNAVAQTASGLHSSNTSPANCQQHSAASPLSHQRNFGRDGPSSDDSCRAKSAEQRTMPTFTSTTKMMPMKKESRFPTPKEGGFMWKDRIETPVDSEEPRMASALNHQSFVLEYSDTGNRSNIIRTPASNVSEFNFDNLPNPLVAVPSNDFDNDWQHFSNQLGGNNIAENLSHTWPNVNTSGIPEFNWHDLPNPLSTDFVSTTAEYDWDNLPNPLIPTAAPGTLPFNWQDLPNPLNVFN
ncbi:hypothetical protein ACJ73_04514 [Blastomyces percursus]|uniref:Uncharacterized protein n=1 Tax=Blastomyces percursus TaxID=1658174 RepID=A0A1J9R910_9EURO|nr:hypothetical protein ACJ73_04514 [Blastomyces percursus]